MAGLISSMLLKQILKGLVLVKGAVGTYYLDLLVCYADCAAWEKGQPIHTGFVRAAVINFNTNNIAGAGVFYVGQVHENWQPLRLSSNS